ncbi:MAG: RNA polymerase sigma factor, partial [Chloroflexota bacterium]
DEKERAVWKALSSLEEKFRLPIVLRYFHELPIAEIAEIMNINEGTVHSRLHSARQRLQTELKSNLAEDLS